MIKSLYIKNFQSHEETKIDLSGGVNIIIGGSDSGKTAIIRAIRWLIWNRPSGNAIRSTWGGNTRVRLCTEKGEIVRNKDKTDTYTLRIPGRKEMAFKAFGTSVPEEVSRFLNIDEINLQQQFNKPFLLSDSPGVVAQHFNKVARLDKIDSGLQMINKWIRNLTQDIVTNKSQRVTLEEGLTKFEHLEKFEAEVEVLEDMDNRLKASNKRLDRLDETIADLQIISSDIKDKKVLIQKETLVNKILNLYKQLNDGENYLFQLGVLQDKISRIRADMEEWQELSNGEDMVLKVLGLYQSKKLNVEQFISIYSAVSELKHIEGLIKTKEKELKVQQATFKREFPNVCPLCNTKLK